MFTRDFSKLKVAGSAVGVAGLIFVAFFGGFLSLARWSERTMDAYPFRAEDWLRYQLPTFFDGRDSARIMLTGPSSIRENFIYDRFEDAFAGMHVRQSAVSMATFDDLLLSLNYLEERFGEDALPEMLVVGINPRFVSDIRRRASPFSTSIDDYCPKYRIESTEDGSQLVEKTKLESLLAQRRFWSKQQPRFKSGLCSAGRLVMPEDVAYSVYGQDLDELNALRRAFTLSFSDVRRAVSLVRSIGLRAAVGRCLRAYTLPYKYHQYAPRPPKLFVSWMTQQPSVWVKVYRWNPTPDEAAIHRRFQRLFDFASKYQIELFFINTPEHEQLRAQYDPENYEEYWRIVKDALGDQPLLDLREELAADEFYDAVHATFDGAMHVTDEVIPFIQSHRRTRSEVSP